jgi:hypothetical protein
MVLVFQYGSNTSVKRLNAPERLDGTATPLALAETVEHFDLAFTYQSKNNGCAAADLSVGGRPILGVLYEIPEERVFRGRSASGARTLDEIEGESRAYRRSVIQVRRHDNGRLSRH